MNELKRGLLRLLVSLVVGAVAWLVATAALVILFSRPNCDSAGNCDDLLGYAVLVFVCALLAFWITAIALVVYNVGHGIRAWNRHRSCRIRQDPIVVSSTFRLVQEPTDDRRPRPRLPAALRRHGP